MTDSMLSTPVTTASGSHSATAPRIVAVSPDTSPEVLTTSLASQMGNWSEEKKY